MLTRFSYPPHTSAVALKGKTKGNFRQPFLGHATDFVYHIDKGIGVKLDFKVHRRACTLHLDKWTDTHGLLSFLPLFFTQHEDDDLFGSSEMNLGMEEGEEELPVYDADIRQQRNIVLRAALDVIMTIDAIHQVHDGAMLDYCCRWQEENNPHASYDNCITYYACCAVVDSMLVAPRAIYPPITYRSAVAMKSTWAKGKVGEEHKLNEPHNVDEEARPISLNSRRVSQLSPLQAGGVPLKGKSEGSFHYPFLGYRTEFRYKIDKDVCVTLDFAVRRRAYSVDFGMWKGSWGLGLFLPLFFMEHDNADLFGISEVDNGDEGEARIVTYRCNQNQKRNIVLQAASDVIMTIDAIHEVHGCWMLDYCCRWQEMGAPYASYDQLITQAACCTVMDNLLLAPDVRYDSVTYETAVSLKTDPAKHKV